jgi:hypothetical protein
MQNISGENLPGREEISQPGFEPPTRQRFRGHNELEENEI